MATTPPPPGLTRPHYASWDMLERFPLPATAWLLHDLEPPMQDGGPSPAFVMSTIADLAATLPPDGPAVDRMAWGLNRTFASDVEWAIKSPAFYCRETLRAWCERAGRPIPPFLLDPEEREADQDAPAAARGDPEQWCKQREQVLGAALALLWAFPEQIKTAADLARLVADKAPLFWPEKGEPPRKDKGLQELISKALHRVKNA